MRTNVITFLMLAGFVAASAQGTKHTGCVRAWKDEPKTLLLSEENSCSVLSGKLITGRLDGHIVTLTGDMTEATSNDPQTIAVKSVGSVGEACAETCTPEPPGHRGLSKRAKPGAQGGTAGRKSEPEIP